MIRKKIKHMFVEDTFFSFSQCQAMHGQMRGPWFLYLQLQNFYGFLISKNAIYLPLKEFEQLCISSLSVTHTLQYLKFMHYYLLLTLQAYFCIRPIGWKNSTTQFILRNGTKSLSTPKNLQWLATLKNAIIN